MITYCVMKIMPMYSPVIGQFFDTMIVTSILLIKSGYNDTSKSKSWNVLETVLSHLNTGPLDTGLTVVVVTN